MTTDGSAIATTDAGAEELLIRAGASENSPATAALLVPVALCVAMSLVSAVLVRAAAVDVRELFLPYFSAAAAISVLSVLGFVFIEIAKLAWLRADDPIPIVKDKLRDRWVLIILPAVMLPVFLIGFTASKTAIQFLVGYTWDSFWANADRLIFGDDVWHLTRRILGSSYSRVWEWLYTVGWGGAFFVVANAIALFAPKRLVGVYFTAMFATWLVGGCFMAYAFSAAGPVFAHLFDPGLTARFQPLRDTLAGSLGEGPIGFTQRYLSDLVNVHVAVKGGGISAMPSMHLASTSIYVLAARGTKWIYPAVLFWIIIFVASGYFGYHYWVDGLVAAPLAAVCWLLAERCYRR